MGTTINRECDGCDIDACPGVARRWQLQMSWSVTQGCHPRGRHIGASPTWRRGVMGSRHCQIDGVEDVVVEEACETGKVGGAEVFWSLWSVWRIGLMSCSWRGARWKIAEYRPGIARGSDLQLGEVSGIVIV